MGEWALQSAVERACAPPVSGVVGQTANKERVRCGYGICTGTCMLVDVALLVALGVVVEGACGWVVGLERPLARAVCRGVTLTAATTRATARTAARIGIRWGRRACKFFQKVA